MTSVDPNTEPDLDKAARLMIIDAGMKLALTKYKDQPHVTEFLKGSKRTTEKMPDTPRTIAQAKADFRAQKGARLKRSRERQKQRGKRSR